MPQSRNDGNATTGRSVGPRAGTVAAAGGPVAGGRALDSRTERDHEAISRLAGDVLPALIAKLSATGLGEIEVRDGDWKARLRKPAGPDRVAPGAKEGHSAHGPVPGRVLAAGMAERERRQEQEIAEPATRPIMATSPAVGVYQPRKDLAAGMRVRAGDRLGTVDVLGVREDVVAPVDGVIGVGLTEAGEAVEYGQELIRIELPENARGLDASGSDREAAAVLGEA